MVVLPLPLGPICRAHFDQWPAETTDPTGDVREKVTKSFSERYNVNLRLLGTDGTTHQRGQLFGPEVSGDLQKQSETLLAVVIILHSVCQVLQEAKKVDQGGFDPVRGWPKTCHISCSGASWCNLSDVALGRNDDTAIFQCLSHPEARQQWILKDAKSI